MVSEFIGVAFTADSFSVLILVVVEDGLRGYT